MTFMSDKSKQQDTKQDESYESYYSNEQNVKACAKEKTFACLCIK